MLKIVATFINRTYGDVYTREYFCWEDELNDEFIDRVIDEMKKKEEYLNLISFEVVRWITK